MSFFGYDHGEDALIEKEERQEKAKARAQRAAFLLSLLGFLLALSAVVLSFVFNK